MNKDIENAIAYVRRNLSNYELQHLRSEVDYALEQHLMPTFIEGKDRIEDLLQEFGEDNELPEDYWQDEIEDILIEL